MKCEKCGEEMQVGDWPFCNPGGGHSPKGTYSNHPDDIPGGLLMENLGPVPIRVYSHTERKRIMKERGLELKERFSPLPGTDIDPQGIPNPMGYLDAQTLENARILLSRSAEPKAKEWDAREAGVISGGFSGHLSHKDAIAVSTNTSPYRQSRVGRRLKGGQ